MCAGRVLGITDKGQLGLFPTSTQKGDIVAIFLGGCVPFIIRPIGNPTMESYTRNQLVGPCYVQGIMYGEGIQRVPYLDLESIWIQ